MTALTELIGRSARIVALRDQVLRVLARQAEGARRSPPILILGETGTGKGLMASSIHGAGARARGPFIDVNCAAIPETLLEAELFGWERGAFTDARQPKPGLFEAAHGGTIFLDEVGLLPSALQSKLLKVIEEQQVRRLGSTRSMSVDASVIAATSEDLDEAIRARRFREDLYHRLAVLTLRLPPLRERGDDVLLLADHFLARACEDYGLARKALTPDARRALLAYPWPGNVRELANVMERAALLVDTPTVTAESLGLVAAPSGSATTRVESGATLEDAMRDVERGRLLEALEKTGGNITRAAAHLGLARNTLRYRLDKHGLGLDAGSARRRGGRPAGSGPRPVASSTPAPAVAPAWESRRVTLLCVAIASLHAETSSSETTRLLEGIMDKARSFGGWIEDVRPSGVVVAFGIDAAEDAPRRAVHTAIAIRQLAARARREDPARPDVRVAVHTTALMIARADGQVTFEGNDKCAAWAVLDGLVERADLAQVVVSASTAGVLGRRFELAPLATSTGAAGAYRLGSYAEREPGRAEFVGRERELRLLGERFEQARAGEGQVVMVVGEPGIGKSRLLRELRQRLGSAAVWVEGHALPFGRTMPFHPVVDMMRRLIGIADSDAEVTIIAKLERRVRQLGDDLEPALPFLRALLGLDPGDPAVDAMDPKLRRVEIFHATQRALARAAEAQPHVIVLEDVHWMDAATEEWLTRLADSLTAKPVLLVVTYRPGYTPPFGDRTFHTRLALTTLSTADSVRMALALLRADRLPADLEAMIVRKAEGNPFFVEELVQSLEEMGAVRREGERLLVTRGLDATLVPDTIQDVVMARIDRLGEAPRRTLRTAAVIGREFTRRLLDRVVEGAPLDDLLGELRAVELIYEQRLFPEVSYAFKHALTHEVAYASIPSAERRALHRRIAEALEALHGDRLAEVAGALARHYSAAEDWERAFGYLVRAAEAAARAFATREALALYDEALAAAERLPGGDPSGVMAIHQARSALYFVVSDFERSRAAAERAGELARDAGDAAREGVALAAMAWAATWARDLDDAVDRARRAIDVAEPVGAGAVLARAHFTIGFVRSVTGGLDEAKGAIEQALVASRSAGDVVHQSLALTTAGLLKSWEGEYADADRLQIQGLAMAREHNLLVPLLFSAFLRGLTLTGKGDYATALTTFHEGLDLSEKVGDEAIHHRLLNCLGWLHFELGDLDRAADLNRRSADVGRRRNDPGTLPNAELNLGDIFLARGDLALARETFDRVDRFAQDPSTSPWMRFRYSIRLSASLGELALARGDLDSARAHAQRCLELAARFNARKNLVKGWRLAGEVAGANRQWDEAERALREALRIAEEIGNPNQLWRTHAALARLHGERGRVEPARHAAREAVRVLDAVLTGLPDPALRDGLNGLPLVGEMRALS